MPIYNAASDWPRIFCTPRVFFFSNVYKREDLHISVSLLKVKQVMFYNQVKQLIIACKTNQTAVYCK